MEEFACPHCPRRFSDEAALERHVEGHRRHAAASPPVGSIAEEAEAFIPEPSRSERWWDRILGGLGLLWNGFWALVVLGIIIGVIAAIFGIGDKDTVDVPSNAPGRAMLSSLEEDGTIDEFRAVDPEDGWDYEYEINGDSGFVAQFRRGAVRDEMQLNFPASDEDVADEISEAARDEGYSP